MPQLNPIDMLDVLGKYDPNMKLADWDAKIKYRGVDFKPPEDLVQARACYEQKVPLLKKQSETLARTLPTVQQAFDANAALQSLVLDYAQLKTELRALAKDDKFGRELLSQQISEVLSEMDALAQIVDHQSQLEGVNLKIARLEDKYASVVMEQAYREAGMVSRTLHHTLYYIDLDGGSDAANGLGTGTAWLTIGKYTTTTVRTAGDIAYVRANTSQIPVADIAFDENGTLAAPISIIGCDSVTNDPWVDASDVRPIVDFADGAYQFVLNTDLYWYFTRLDIRQSADTLGAIRIYASTYGAVFTGCIFQDNAANGILAASSVKVIDCQFLSNIAASISATAGTAYIENSVFDGGAATTNFGVSALSAYIINSTFGVTTDHALAALSISGMAICRNCLFSDVAIQNSVQPGVVFSEDHNQVKGASYSVSYEGTVERDADPQLDSLDSILMTPFSTLSLGLTISQGYLNDYAVWCPASATTITIKARETAAWTADPTADEFYFEASYLNHATAATRSTVVSAQALSGITEISFTMTFTPAAAGWAYITCYLKKYEAGKSVNVSVKPVVT